MNKGKLTVRRVTKDDYDNVMAIDPSGEIYGGTDYLPEYFLMLIDLPNVEAYGALDGEKIISFVLLTIVDNGKTVIYRAGRTHKNYAGKDAYQFLFSWVVQVISKDRALQYQAATSGSHVKGFVKQIERGIHYKVLEQEFRYYTCLSKTDSIGPIQNTHVRNSAKQISVHELEGILCNPNLCSHLFPDGRIIVDCVPYRPMKSNASLIKSKRTSVVSSNVHQAKQTMLTFFNYFNAPVGLVCNFDVYGHLDSRLTEHLLMHLENKLLYVRPGKILIRIFCRHGTNWDFVSNLMKGLNILEETEQRGSGLICAESKLKRSSQL